MKQISQKQFYFMLIILIIFIFSDSLLFSHGPTQTHTDVFLKFANDRYEPCPDALPFTIASSPEIFIQKIGDSHETLTTHFLLYLAKYE